MACKLKWTRNTFRNLDFGWKPGSPLAEMSAEVRERAVDDSEYVRKNVVTKSSIQKVSLADLFLYSISMQLKLFSSNPAKQGTTQGLKIFFRFVIQSWEEKS